jgi:intracellular septation protein
VLVLIATAAMLFIFGELSIWLNDPRLVKIKPTVIYFGLGLFVSVGLLRGKLWLKYIIQEMLPMEEQGWRILTKRVMVLFFSSAASNELV